MSVHQLLPLPIVILLLTAAAIVVTGPAPRRVHDVMATTAALASTVLCAVFLAHARSGPIVEWLGGWKPHHGVATGIALTADQLGAGAALLAAALLAAALIYSWSYFSELDGLVHALVLVAGAAMIGLCLSGDLFTIIVFFVLTTVPAIALMAVESEHSAPLQGAINFGVVNSIAGFAALMGTALVYGRTGALNLAQIGMSLDHHPADALVAMAFGLLAVTFLTKAGVVPFHFWLPDAHAVAPAPVSGLFSSAMVMTALFALTRLLSTAFAQPLEPHTGAVRALLVGVGVITALVGAVASFEQRHIKRMLAFVTAQQVGIALCGVGLLHDEALAGAAISAAGAGLTLAALFWATGLLIRRRRAVDEYALYGCGRDTPLTAVTFFAGALTVASLPFTAGFVGGGLIANGARAVGYSWLPPVLTISGAIAGAALLRVGVRVFLGRGASEPHEPEVESEARSQRHASLEEEQDEGDSREPTLVLRVLPLLLIGAVFALGLMPGFSDSVQTAAAHFRDVKTYMAVVLSGAKPTYAPVATEGIATATWLYAIASLLTAGAIAAVALGGRRVLPLPAADALRAAQSGHVGDYVAWWTFGTATIGGLALWAIAG